MDILKPNKVFKNMINSLKKLFIDPCEKCLVQACCFKECDDRKKYKNLHENFYIIIGFSIILIVLLLIIFVYIRLITC